MRINKEVLLLVMVLFRFQFLAAQETVVRPVPEKERNLGNPLTGWAIYANAFAKPDYWQRFDSLAIAYGGKGIEDFANVLYLRVAWSDMEPEEHVYGWKSNATIKMLIAGAIERKMKLAFRIVVDSRDKPKDFTPGFVREAGAKGFFSGRRRIWSPYVDDRIFQIKYAQFLKAFAGEFNNPALVDFIDAYGLGKWGESHSVNYIDNANRVQVFEWVNGLYAQYFTRVPLVINYHRLIGTPKDWGAPDSLSRPLLEAVFAKGFGLRHDAFGMTGYYKEWEKRLAADWFPRRPVICEGGWLHNGDGYLKDPRGYRNWGEAWQGEFDDAVAAHANMMDLRDMKEASSWFETAMPLVKKFIAIGGYRLYPEEIKLPGKVVKGRPVTITHCWSNLGMGVCPSNLPQWNQKYKVAFALIDKKSGAISGVWVENDTDVSQWLNGVPVTYTTSIITDAIAAGEYRWAVAIADTTNDNKAGILLAVKGAITADGWLPLAEVSVE